jgi:hypothetical protein
VGLYQIALKDVELGLGRLRLLSLALDMSAQNAIYQLRQTLATSLRLALKLDRHVELDIDCHLGQELTS